MLEVNAVHCGDCLELMREISDESVDMILCDLPYGTTQAAWDSVIPFEPLWAHYKRIIKPGRAIVLTACQPFTSALVMSNVSWFKYEWIWEKNIASNFLNGKVHPLRFHENICVFGNGALEYHPQKTSGKPYKIRKCADRELYGKGQSVKEYDHDGTRAPSSIIKVAREVGKHPTQKPAALFQYLIRTYTNEGEVVLDNCAGSGTTGVAALNEGRNFILIEQEPDFCEVARKRLRGAGNLFSGLGVL